MNSREKGIVAHDATFPETESYGVILNVRQLICSGKLTSSHLGVTFTTGKRFPVV